MRLWDMLLGDAGIGKELAQIFAAEGCHPVLVARGRDKLAALLSETFSRREAGHVDPRAREWNEVICARLHCARLNFVKEGAGAVAAIKRPAGIA
jgi:NAD(P)-dependent dehydrogenase (short-subunit alcohol dehydrogenase family)